MTDNARGSLMMMVGMAAFVLNDTLMKLVSSELPLFQALLLRGVLTTAAFAALAWHKGVLSPQLAGRDRALILVRVASEAGAAWFFLTALFNMPLANLTAILQALPLTITLAGALFLGDRVGWRRMLAIMVGFAGVLLIVRPGADGFDLFAVYALISVAFVTLRDLVTRRMTATVPSLTIALWTAAGVTSFAGFGSLTETWVMPSTWAVAWLAGAVVFIVVGYLLAIMAVRVGDLAVVTPFRYTGLVWALLLGLFVFGDWPDGLTMAGAALIVATGLYTFFRERQLAQAARRQMARTQSASTP